MSTVLDILAAIMLGLGSVFYLVGAIGLQRMPDVFTRMHATSVSDTLGIGFLIGGMIVMEGFTLIAFKLIMILLVLLFSGAIASHALARAALHDGNKPLLADAETGELKETDPVDLFPELRGRLNQPLRSESVEEAEILAISPPQPGEGR